MLPATHRPERVISPSAIAGDARSHRIGPWARPAPNLDQPNRARNRHPRRVPWLRDAERIDVAVYAAIARTPTPALDTAMNRVSRAADYSKLWVAAAALQAVLGGRRGRRAAVAGLASVGVAAAVANLALKPLGGRRRPERVVEQVPVARWAGCRARPHFRPGTRPRRSSRDRVGHVLPIASIPRWARRRGLVFARPRRRHYPGDVVAGALVGTMLAQLTTRALDRSLAVS